MVQQLHRMQRLVALVGEGRSGKGTLLRVVTMLVGESATRSYSGGPGKIGEVAICYEWPPRGSPGDSPGYAKGPVPGRVYTGHL